MATYKVSVMTLYESDDTSPGESFKMSDFCHYTFYDQLQKTVESHFEIL